MTAVMEERYSYHIIRKEGEFLVKIPAKHQSSLVECVWRFSGRNMDKLKNVKKTRTVDIVDVKIDSGMSC